MLQPGWLARLWQVPVTTWLLRSNPHSHLCSCVTTLEAFHSAQFWQVGANFWAFHPQIFPGKKCQIPFKVFVDQGPEQTKTQCQKLWILCLVYKTSLQFYCKAVTCHKWAWAQQPKQVDLSSCCATAQSRTKSSLPGSTTSAALFSICPELYSHFHYGHVTKHSKWGLRAWKMWYFTVLCSCSSKMCFERTGVTCQERL